MYPCLTCSEHERHSGTSGFGQLPFLAPKIMRECVSEIRTYVPKVNMSLWGHLNQMTDDDVSLCYVSARQSCLKNVSL
jgi:hypothetical protein